MKRNRTWFGVVASLLLIASTAVSTACGVPLDDSPRAINRTTTTTPVATTADVVTGPRVTLYFVNEDGGLVGQTTPSSTVVNVEGAVAALLRTRPSPPLSTRIPADTRLVDLDTSGDLVTVNLTGQIGTIRGEAEEQAYAQIVFTILAFPRYERVRFLIEGEVIAAPTDRENREIVTADDFDPPLNPN
ncbi:MAG: GerMN domain-containing protein [Acidimicrobiales bacterium]|nr:GerMN domain-containing protein [Acidimicrobiales bacterium]